MSSNFDIEAAKRGEQVQISWKGKWEQVHFVGTSNDGHPVIQFNREDSPPFVANQEFLRMSSKKIKVRYRLYLDRSDNRVIAVNDESLAKSIEDAVRWLTDWQEAEIEQ